MPSDKGLAMRGAGLAQFVSSLAIVAAITVTAPAEQFLFEGVGFDENPAVVTMPGAASAAFIGEGGTPRIVSMAGTSTMSGIGVAGADVPVSSISTSTFEFIGTATSGNTELSATGSAAFSWLTELAIESALSSQGATAFGLFGASAGKALTSAAILEGIGVMTMAGAQQSPAAMGGPSATAGDLLIRTQANVYMDTTVDQPEESPVSIAGTSSASFLGSGGPTNADLSATGQATFTASTLLLTEGALIAPFNTTGALVGSAEGKAYWQTTEPSETLGEVFAVGTGAANFVGLFLDINDAPFTATASSSASLIGVSASSGALLSPTADAGALTIQTQATLYLVGATV